MAIILGGAADLPLEELGGKTPLQVARMPHLQGLARIGRVGSVATIPPGWDAGTDVSSMCLLGYDPRRYHSGRAPLEAAAMGLKPGASDWIYRLNLVTVGLPRTEEAGQMLDHRAGEISDREARTLLEDLVAYWKAKVPELFDGVAVHPGVGYRNILIDSRPGRDHAKVSTVAPHAIIRRGWSKHLPSGGAGDAAGLVQQLMSLSSEVLPQHEVNIARMEQGLAPANMAWIWGPGTWPNVPPFAEKFGLRGSGEKGEFKGAMISGVDLVVGLARYVGWEVLTVPGVSGDTSNDYSGQGRATVDAIGRFDLVCCQVGAAEEASIHGDVNAKVLALEAIDREIVGPVAERLKRYGDPEKDAGSTGWRMLVMSDLVADVKNRRHDCTPVPFMIAGAWVRSMVEREFSEKDGAGSDLRIAEGAELMEYFLRGGLRNIRPRTK